MHEDVPDIVLRFLHLLVLVVVQDVVALLYEILDRLYRLELSCLVF
jgi:hypothetical protein